VGLAEAVFVAPPALTFLYLIWRELRKGGEVMSSWKAEAEAEAAEGFPPPDPPTTDSQPD
jgi:hypothetical protein